MVNRVRSINAVGQDSSGGILGQVLGSVTQSATDRIAAQLPTQQQVIQAYLGAIVAFWIIGGITLWLVLKRK